MKTTNLLVGEFDILAAGLFAFRERWDFAFALNRTLPKSSNSVYTAHQRDNLIASMIPITWPVAAPFTTDLYGLLDTLVGERQRLSVAPETAPVVSAAIEDASGPSGSEAPINAMPKKRKKKS